MKFLSLICVLLLSCSITVSHGQSAVQSLDHDTVSYARPSIKSGLQLKGSSFFKPIKITFLKVRTKVGDIMRSVMRKYNQRRERKRETLKHRLCRVKRNFNDNAHERQLFQRYLKTFGKTADLKRFNTLVASSVNGMINDWSSIKSLTKPGGNPIGKAGYSQAFDIMHGRIMDQLGKRNSGVRKQLNDILRHLTGTIAHRDADIANGQGRIANLKSIPNRTPAQNKDLAREQNSLLRHQNLRNTIKSIYNDVEAEHKNYEREMIAAQQNVRNMLGCP